MNLKVSVPKRITECILFILNLKFKSRQVNAIRSFESVKYVCCGIYLSKIVLKAQEIIGDTVRPIKIVIKLGRLKASQGSNATVRKAFFFFTHYGQRYNNSVASKFLALKIIM